MSKQRIQAVMLDVGNVLIRIDERRTAEALAAGSDKPAAFYLDMVQYESELMARMYAGLASTEEVLEEHRRLYGSRLDEAGFRDAWLAMLGEPVKPTCEAVSTLPRRIRRLILSNTMNAHLPTLRADPVIASAERLFASCEMGMVKPDEAIYQAVLAETQLSPGQVLFFDDNAANILAAEAVGLNSVLVADDQTVTRTLGEYGLV